METKTKILFVDDNAQMRHLLQITFSVYPEYELFQAQSGEEAISLLRKEKPDIVFLDVMMPGGIDGLSVCKFIKSTPALELCFVVLLSAKGQREDIEAGLEVGADKYITKPFSPLSLVEVASDFCANRLS